MQIQYIKNQFDNNMISVDITPEIYNNIINCIKKPIIISLKENIPQWKFCTVKGNIRCNANMDKTNILMLDYDNSNYSIKEFENTYSNFKYILHTSYSYNGTNNKFRVLLFLDKEYEFEKLFCKTNNVLYNTYNYLINFFPFIDKASFVKSQFFKVPAIKNNNSPYYFNIHGGELFSPENHIKGFFLAYNNCINIFKNEQESNKIRAKINQTNNNLSSALEYVKKQIENAPKGERHNIIFAMAGWYSKCGGDYLSFSTIIPSWADKNYTKQIKRLEHEWNIIGQNR